MQQQVVQQQERHAAMEHALVEKAGMAQQAEEQDQWVEEEE